MNLPLFIAYKYLFTKKSQSVINLIAYISMVGVLIGSMALIIVMSVFNGFEDLTESLYNTFDPEIKVTPYQGKTFELDSLLIQQIKEVDGVADVARTLEENVLITYDDRQILAQMKGVDSVFAQYTPLKEEIVDGRLSFYHGFIPTAVLGYSLSYKLGLRSLKNLNPILFYVPKRGDVSLSNPAEALHTMEIYPAGVFMVEQSFDDKYVFVPLAFARELLDSPAALSTLELYLHPSGDVLKIQKDVKEIVGTQFEVRTRHEQNAGLYKMMQSEKMIIYCIFVFIIVILSFNIAGSLFMLITDKKDDIESLKHLGANRKMIRRIFLYEGWLICLIGMGIGLILGIVICLLQQQYGLLKIPGNNLIIDAYPVSLHVVDVFTILGTVGSIGFFISLFSTSYLKK